MDNFNVWGSNDCHQHNAWHRIFNQPNVARYELISGMWYQNNRHLFGRFENFWNFQIKIDGCIQRCDYILFLVNVIASKTVRQTNSQSYSDCLSQSNDERNW